MEKVSLSPLNHSLGGSNCCWRKCRQPTPKTQNILYGTANCLLQRDPLQNSSTKQTPSLKKRGKWTIDLLETRRSRTCKAKCWKENYPSPSKYSRLRPHQGCILIWIWHLWDWQHITNWWGSHGPRRRNGGCCPPPFISSHYPQHASKSTS